MGPLVPRPRGDGAGRTCGAALVLLVALTPASFCVGEPAPASPDGARWSFEVGAGTNVSNELFYEDAFIDTTFLGRRLVSTPETRWAALGRAALDGTRAGGAVRYSIQGDASIGDLLQAGAAGVSWRGPISPRWSLATAPHVEYRRDHTFGRDLEQWQGETGVRLRRSFDDEETALELGLRGDGLHATGPGSEFLPDRLAGRAWAGLERSALFGSEWRVGYGFAARGFPDSVVRDHLEHTGDAQWRLMGAGGSTIALELSGTRRATLRSAPTSRDRFVEGRGSLESALRLGDSWALEARVEGEWMRYDAEDSTLYFDYRVLRARFGPRYDASTRWNLAVGPRVEILDAPRVPAEAYREVGGFAELEWFAPRGGWSVTPAAGWRDYDAASDAGWPLVHTSYAFLETGLIGDQPLPGALRLRTIGATRFEWHVDGADDARSLYFALELRRLF